MAVPAKTDLVSDNERLRARLVELESENHFMRGQLTAVNELIRTFPHQEHDERERSPRDEFHRVDEVSAGGPSKRSFAAGDVQTLCAQLQQGLEAHMQVLRSNQERFDLAVRGTSDGVFERDIVTNQVWWSDQIYKLLGYDPSELVASYATFLELLHPDDRLATEHAMQAHLEQRSPFDVEYRLQTRDGDYRWFRGRAQALWNAKGRPIRFAGSIQDINDRKQIEISLRESERRFRSIFEQAAVGIGLVETKTGVLVRVNQKYCDLLGYSREELSGKSFHEITHSDDLRHTLEHLQSLAAGDLDGFTLEQRYRRKDGKFVWVNLTVSPICDPGEFPKFKIAVIQEISERKQAEADLRRTESIQRSIMDSSLDCIMLVDPQANIRFINRTAPGLRIEDVIDTPIYQYVTEEFRPRVRDCLERVVSTGQPDSYQVDYTTTDGQITTWDARVAPVWAGDQITALTVIARDETELKQSVSALKDSERTLAKAQQIAHIGSWEHHLKSRKTQCSSELLRIIGLADEQDGLGHEQFIHEFVHPGDRALVQQAYREAVETAVTRTIEFRILRINDRQVRYVRAEAEIVFDHDQRPIKIVGTLQDNTEQKLVELALRESEEKFRALTERSPAIVFIAQGKQFLYGNARLPEITGYSLEELMQIDFLNIVHPDYRDLVAEKRRSLSRQNPRQRFEIKIVTKSTDERWLDTSSQFIEYDGRPAALVTCADISERKLAEQKIQEMETQLSHVSRLSTMGEMVAGIAHEINQPLSAIAHFALACQNTIEISGHHFDVPIEEWLTKVNEQAVRCGDIIRRLRNFVKKGVDDRAPVNVNGIVQDSVDLMRSDLRNKSVVIECRLADPSPILHANQIQLQQVVVNLLNNAADAARDKDTPTIHVAVHQDADDVLISVEDNGPGIDEHARERLFDAFYTTKSAGMGMGLAISKSIVEAHNGRLTAVSPVGQGARFLIELPAAMPVEEVRNAG